ncbi:hypothetical protein [Nocardiopsis synnemataformans]|uniref:hypothetical protein n=1 Tax=Nocardiopsis synnemataformans TaxID=61305 RepID=UPI003EBAACF0
MSTDLQYPDAHRGFEIRVSPDQRHIAEFRPTNAPWFIPVENSRGRFVRTAELDAAGWVQYVPIGEGAAQAVAEAQARVGELEEQQATILRTVSEWVRSATEHGGVDAGNLVWDLEQVGLSLPTADADPTGRSGR